MQPAVSSAERAALMTRALARICPVNALTLTLWLLLPHPAAAHEGWLVAANLALAPVYAVLLLRRSLLVSRAGVNAAAAAGTLATIVFVYAGGGLASGFELGALWFLPLAACTLPRGDVAVHVGFALAGYAVVTSLHAGSLGGDPLGGFAVQLVAPVAVNAAFVNCLYGRLQATTHDFRRRSAEDPPTGPANRAALQVRLDAIV